MSFHFFNNHNSLFHLFPFTLTYCHRCVFIPLQQQASCLLPSQQQTRKASAVVDVQDPKEFKKLLKTTPNVLCLFVKGAGVAKEMKRVVGLTAEQVKGVGSVFYVDCSGYVLHIYLLFHPQ